MNKTMLSTALLTILSTAAYADNSVQPTTPLNAASPTSTAPVSALPASPAPATIKPTEITTPQPAPVINCKYHIPAETSKIEPTLLSTWAGKAAVQSFEFNPATIDNELTELKSCYTDPGWQGFNDALQKSGNIDAIKSQHLTVSSQVNGEVTVTVTKDNQWKAIVPIQVVYQNDKEKLTQELTIQLLVGRKISGDLGIMQMIATPRQNAAAQQPEAPASTSAPSGEQPIPTAAPANAQKQMPRNSQPAAAPLH